MAYKWKLNTSFKYRDSVLKVHFSQPDLTAIRTYFTRWLIRTTSLVQIHTMFAKSYVFYELSIRMNLYEWSTPNPALKPTHHWGLDKSY